MSPGFRNELRIIGGQWRGRRLRFPPLPGIRPTPDRVRETVFNWLQHHIAGSGCLDLFAGSGALGLEALSRGAAHVTFVDTERAVGDHLRLTLELLAATGSATVKVQDARRFLAAVSPEAAFDVVFLDPPFSMQGLPEICLALEQGGCLAKSAFIYLETPALSGEPRLPEGWTLLKSKKAGEVGYHLAQRVSPRGAI